MLKSRKTHQVLHEILRTAVSRATADLLSGIWLHKAQQSTSLQGDALHSRCFYTDIPMSSSHHRLRVAVVAGYVSFMFFRTKAWWAPPLKLLLRCALWLVGVTQRLPLFRVCGVHL